MIYNINDICLYQFEYTNHRGEKKQRLVTVQGVCFGSNEYYKDEQFFLQCNDFTGEKLGEPRNFAIANITHGTFEKD